MFVMRLDLALFFVFDLALLNLRARDCDYTRCEGLEEGSGEGVRAKY
jgi:hypothetical protein